MSYVLQTSKQSSIVRSTHWCDQCNHQYQNYQSDHNVKSVTLTASHCLFIMEQTQAAYWTLFKKHKNTICENTSFPYKLFQNGQKIIMQITHKYHISLGNCAVLWWQPLFVCQNELSHRDFFCVVISTNLKHDCVIYPKWLCGNQI